MECNTHMTLFYSRYTRARENFFFISEKLVFLHCQDLNLHSLPELERSGESMGSDPSRCDFFFFDKSI